MMLVTYDCEVFAYDWLVVFKDYESKHFTVIHNDNQALLACINEDSVYCGFNSKSYDQYIIKAICAGFSQEEVKQVNDWIIAGNQGWECPLLQGVRFWFNNIDIKDDMQIGLSLKAIEGHLGMDICETEVDFTLNRPLTIEELESTIFYCKHDVDATEKIIDLRKNYLQNKINIGKLAGLDEVKAMSMTNAKLTAALLKARLVEHDDERCYQYPENLRREYIPQEVFDFFDRMKDDSLSDKEVFTGKLNISIGECPVTIGYGGIHGAIPNFLWQEGTGRIIRNYDVASYYPHLMTLYGYTSRNIPSPEVFSEVLESRMKAKAAGDTAAANALKLVVNTTYGASLNKYNDLCDPLMGRSVCITGQLFLLELAQHLYKDIADLRIVQLNTDGIMIEFDDSQYGQVREILNEWQSRTGFELEEDCIAQISQKDVNNYVEVQPSGKFKCKGGYLVRGISPAGAFNVNNNATIVAKALVEYFVNGTPPEDTINACDDIFQFQIIAKAGAKYREAYHMVDGEKVSVQKVNRIYATADPRYGKLFKVKAENDAEAKIEMLPEHCIIDNDNHLTIADVDKQFYIDMAKKRINDFMGIKPEKKGRRKLPKLIGIIDADLAYRTKHRFPNLACMKISGYWKSQNVTVKLLVSPTPEEISKFDKVYLSKVFTDTVVPENILECQNLEYGGTGFFYDKAPRLPEEIEHAFPDYHLYDTWLEQIGDSTATKFYTDYSIGFTTRGCFRQCPFCVNRNYRKVEKHSPLSEFYDPTRPKICLLDDNFLGCSDWENILTELQSTGKSFQFRQGLDIRILTDKKAEKLFASKYDDAFIFAFDDVADYEIIEEKLKLVRKYTNKKLKFYLFCGFDRNDKWDDAFWQQDAIDIFTRVKLLMKYNALPYLMRFERYSTSPNRDLYIALAQWLNQPRFYMKQSFREHILLAREEGRPTYKYAVEYEKKHPEITPYYEIKIEKENKTMATTSTPKNVYQRLLEARILFMEEDVKKSGKNMKMSYKYFELQDIVPVALPIFLKVGLLPVTTFENDVATMTIHNVDEPSEYIDFTSPMREIDPIVSAKTGGEVTNAIQRLGSVETYQRRYLYMIALDIVESDSIEPTTGENTPPAPKPTAPVTPEKRQEVTKNLTAPDGNATELQIKGLKTVMAKLLEKNPAQEDFVTQIALQTNGLTEISKADCEKLVQAITTMLEEQ